jgi:histidyl-tRNA synthetase
MIPDAELISLLCTILGKLDVGEFTVKAMSCFLQVPLLPVTNLTHAFRVDQPSQDLGQHIRGVRCPSGENSSRLVDLVPAIIGTGFYGLFRREEMQVGVGSIAAGGRYDGLVGMFTTAAAVEGKKGAELPCVGVSIGLDRVFALVWPKWVEKGMGRCKETMVYVVAAGDGLLEERVKLARELRGAGIKVPRLSLCVFLLF